MQPETPQGNQPAVQPPVIPPTPPQGEQRGEPEQSFYTPVPQPNYVGQKTATRQTNQPASSSITWDASEYVHFDKGGLWIVGFSVIVLVLLGIAIWLSAWTFAILIVVMAIAMAIFAFRPPRILHYVLNDNGVQINNQNFVYSDFRAFGVLQDGAFFTLTFIPVKRFSPALSVYFAEDHGEQIVDLVGNHLPMEHIEPDFIDTLMRRLHF